jgi:hypothetical protein
MFQELAKRQEAQLPVKDWKERQFRQRGVSKYPEEWFYLEHPTHKDWYQKEMAKRFVSAAKDVGVDPYDYLAVGVSESGLGNLHPSNPARIDWDAHQKFLTGPGDPGSQRSIEVGAILLKEALSKYVDRLSGLQAYSGTGKTIYGGNPKAVEALYGTTKIFGKPFQQIDFWKEKPQGKRVDAISQLLRKNPEVIDLIRQLSNRKGN